MAWTRIDDQFLKNPKIQRAGVYGVALYIAGLIYCNTNKTDGFIDEYLLPGLCGDTFQTPARKSAEKLVELKLWHKVDGGYVVNDFLDFNRSKDEIEGIIQKRAEAGAKGGRTKAANAKRNAINNEANAKQNDSKVVANAKQNAKQNSTPNTLIPLLTTDPPFNPPTRSEDQEKTVKMLFDVFQEIMGFMPVIGPTQAQLVQEMANDNITESEYRTALLQMRDSGYECKTPASAHTWILNNRKPKKKRNGNGAGRDYPHPIPGRKIPGYVPDTSNTEVVYGD